MREDGGYSEFINMPESLKSDGGEFILHETALHAEKSESTIDGTDVGFLRFHGQGTVGPGDSPLGAFAAGVISFNVGDGAIDGECCWSRLEMVNVSGTVVHLGVLVVDSPGAWMAS